MEIDDINRLFDQSREYFPDAVIEVINETKASSQEDFTLLEKKAGVVFYDKNNQHPYISIEFDVILESKTIGTYGCLYELNHSFIEDYLYWYPESTSV